jgi:hypothetical protein
MRILTTPALCAALALAACGDKDPADGKSSGDDTDPTTSDDTDGASGDDTDVEDDSDPPSFPPGTYQVRVLNLLPREVNFFGTDADSAEIDLDVAAKTFSDYQSVAVGAATLTLDDDVTAAPIDLSNLVEYDRVVLIIGEVASYSRILGVREPARTPGSRTMVFATTGRTVELSTETAYLQIPTGEAGEVLTFNHTLPNEQAQLIWRTYGKPFVFTTSRIPEGGLAYVVNSNIAGDGWGTYYLATNAPGPVQELPTDIPFYAYSTDPSMSGVTFTARTPLGDVQMATNVGMDSTAALPYAYVPADATEVVATDGTTTVTQAFEREAGVEHAIAVLHQVDGESTIGFVQGEPNDRSTYDAWATFSNFTPYNLDLRCYYGFGGYQAPGGSIFAFVAPQATLATQSTQRCNLTYADVPDAPPADPMQNFNLSTSFLRGYHKGFVTAESEFFRIYYTFRVTDDPNVYIGSTSASVP